LGFGKKVFPLVPLVEDGRKGVNIGLKSTFLIKEELSKELLEVMQDTEKANVLVRECFFKLPFFATPRQGAYHYAMDGYNEDSAASLFPEVKVTNTTFTTKTVPMPEFCAISQHPSLRTGKGVPFE
jgi:hypothetical protein